MNVYFSKKIDCWVAECGKEKSVIPNWTPKDVSFKKRKKSMLSKEQIEILIKEKKSLLDKLLMLEQNYIDSVIEDTKKLGEIRDGINDGNELIDDLESMLKECQETP